MKVRTRHLDGDTLYRVAEFEAGGRTVETPVKALELYKVPAAVELDPSIGGVSECFRTVGRNQLKGWMTDGDRDRSYLKTVKAAQARARARGDVHILFLELDTTKLEPRELEFISDTAHAFTDIVSVPLEKDLHKSVKGADSREFARYVKFVKDFVAEVDKHNGKPMMAMMPSLPWQFTKDLTETYLGLGFRAFCFDFAGRTPSSTEERNIRPFLKQLRQEKIEDEVILYALNANTGKASKAGGTKVAPAKDILSFGFGFDVLGQKHIGLKGPKEMYESMAKKGPRVRLFDKEAYGYRITAPAGVRSILAADSAVEARAFAYEGTRAALQAYVNMEQHAKEARRLHRVIRESTVSSYLENKSAMDGSDRERMKDARESMAKGKSLDDW